MLEGLTKIKLDKKRQQGHVNISSLLSEASARIIDQGRDFDGFQQRGTLKEIIYDKTSSLSGKEICG